MNKKILFLSCVLIQVCFAADGGGGAAGRPAGVDAGAGARGGFAATDRAARVITHFFRGQYLLTPEALRARLIAEGLRFDGAEVARIMRIIQLAQIPLRGMAIPLPFDDELGAIAGAEGLVTAVSLDPRYRSRSAGALRPGRTGRGEISRVGAAGSSKSLSRSSRTRSTSAQRAARSGVIPSDLIVASHRRAPSASAAAAGAYPGDGDGAGDAGGAGRARSRSRGRSRGDRGSSAACGGPAAAAGRIVGLGGLPAGILGHIAGFSGPGVAGQLSLTSIGLKHQLAGYPGLEWSRATWCRTIDLTSFDLGTIESFELKPLEGKQFAFSMGVKQGRCCRPQNQQHVGIFNWSLGQPFLLRNMSYFSENIWQYGFSLNGVFFVWPSFLDGQANRQRRRQNGYNLTNTQEKRLVSSVALPHKCKVAISGNGQYVATWDRSASLPVSIYNACSGEKIRTLPLRHFTDGYVENYKVAISFSGERFAEIVNGRLFISDVRSGSLLQQFDRIYCNDIEFSRCGKLIFVTSTFRNVSQLRIINLETRQTVYSLEIAASTLMVSVPAASPCGNYVATCTYVSEQQKKGRVLKTLKIIDVRTNQCLKEFAHDHPMPLGDQVVIVKFSSCGNYLMVYDRDNPRKIQILKKGGHPLPPDYVPDAPRRGAVAGGGAAGDGGGPAAAAAAGPH